HSLLSASAEPLRHRVNGGAERGKGGARPLAAPAARRTMACIFVQHCRQSAMAIRGRGTDQNPHNRYAPLRSEADPDHIDEEELIARHTATEVRQEQARSIIS